jgi:hypothetical protein
MISTKGKGLNLNTADVHCLEYDTYFNGGNDFRVKILNDNKVVVYKLKSKNINDEWKLIETTRFDFEVQRILIGKSPKTYCSLYSGGYGDKYDGNSILLHLEKNKYVFICEKMYSFESIDEIYRFVSPVGNSGCPYPYAFDRSHNVYLFIENIVLLNNGNIDKLIEAEKYMIKKFSKYSSYTDFKGDDEAIGRNGDVYDYYYEGPLTNDEDVDDIETVEENTVESYYVGSQACMADFISNPEKNYDMLLNSLSPKERKLGISAVYSNGKKVKLTKEMYVKIHKDHAEKSGFAQFNDYTVICGD